MRIKDEIYPIGNLNTDDDQRFFKNGETDYRLNAVPFDDSNQGLVTNMKGNEQITHAYTHSSGTTFKVIGGCYDSQRNAYYYFILNTDDSDDCILRYNIDDNDFDKIVWDSQYLEFADSLITDAFVLGDHLFWNQSSDNPKMLNIERCANYYIYEEIGDTDPKVAGEYFKYRDRIFEVIRAVTATAAQSDIDDGEFEYVQWTGEGADLATYDYFYNTVYHPRNILSCEYGNDTGINYNNLTDKVFQFTYRYVLTDGRTSLYAPYTGVLGPNNNEDYLGITEDNQVDNKITIDVEYPISSPYNYNTRYGTEAIEIVFREATDTGWGNWKLAGKLDWVDVINNTDFVFRNDKNYDEVDQSEVARQYTNLPVSARCQFPLGNRIGYSGVTQGYKSVIPNVEIAATFNEQSITQTGTTTKTYTWTVTESTYYGEREWEYRTTITAATAGEAFIMTVDGKTASFIITASEAGAGNLSAYVDKVVELINNNFGVAENASGEIVLFYLRYSATVTAIEASSPTSTSMKLPGFKTGAKHQYCLFYYDDLMRRGPAVISDDLEIYAEFPTEVAGVTAGNVHRYSMGFTIKHLPPSWASYWSIGYAGSNVQKFWQYTILEADNVAGGGGTRIYTTITYPQYAEYTEICIDPLQYHKSITDSDNAADLLIGFPNSNIDLYEFQEGDRVRFITDGTITGAAGMTMTSYEDYEIRAYDESGAGACIFIEDLTSLTIGPGSVIEIYRPKKENEATIYREIGSLYSVYESSGVKYHAGLEQSQTSSQDALVNVQKGDVYHLTRVFSKPINTSTTSELFPVESFSYSDWYDSEVWGQGKLGIPSSIGQTISNDIIFSNTLVENTKLNGLSDFTFDNYKEVTSLYGNVYAARLVGSVIKLITDGAVISAGVGVQEYADATGSSTVATSDRVVGYLRVSQQRYGTIHPESVSVVDGAMYFWDYKNACVVRDSGNGLFPISGSYPTQSGGTDHKMRTFFRQVRDNMLSNTYTNYNVWCAYEQNYDLLYLYFNDTTDADNNVLISYHISTGRWFSEYEWSDGSDNWPYHIGGGGRFFTSTIGENLYKHFSSTSNRCTFYGSAKTFEVRVYTAKGNSEVKIYDRFAIQSNMKPAVNDVQVNTLEDADGVMHSIIPANYIEKIENGYFAPFLRNISTYTTYYTADTTTNIITGWVDVVNFDNFTSSGADITSGVETVDEAHGVSNTFSVKRNMTYKLTTNLTLNSGARPSFKIGSTYATSTLIGVIPAGAGTLEYTAPADATGQELFIVNEGGNVTDFSCTLTMTETRGGELSKGLITGDLLRGNSLRLDLDYTTATSEIKIFKVVIGSELSQV